MHVFPVFLIHCCICNLIIYPDISVWFAWHLRCSQMWISNAKEAGVFVVFATIDPALGYKGITAFVIDKVRDCLPSTIKIPE